MTLPALAWPGHDFEQWRKTTAWTKPDLKTDQAGNKNLVPLLGSGTHAIDGIKAWEERRAQYADAILTILGDPEVRQPPATTRAVSQPGDPRQPLTTTRAASGPSDLKPPLTTTRAASGLAEAPAPLAEVLGEEVLPDHIRRHIRIRTDDDWIPAYVLLPKSAGQASTMPSSRPDAGSTRLPAMICLHQTVAQGKDEPAGIKGDPELAFALQLVRRGYVCIAPDAIGFGERIAPATQPYANSLDFYNRHPKWSFMGKMIRDVARVVDYLETLGAVDPRQIGCMGHSHGAYGTLFAAAFEPRISVAIASCGFTTFRSDPAPNRWSHLTALIPQIGLYLPNVENIPFDWQHICAMIAPRPLYVWYATKDEIFPKTDNLEALFRDVATVYGLYGAADDLAWRAFDGPHAFPQAGREAAYRWLQDRLFAVGDIHGLPDGKADWEAQRDTIRRLVWRTIGTPAIQVPDAAVKVLSTEQTPRYERRLIEYAVEKNERIRAYLCVPVGAQTQPSRLPGILVLHQTTPEGKQEVVGIAGDKSVAFAAELADRGFITLAPDSITAGERIDRYNAFDTRGYYLRHPELSAMGKMVYDARRALDVLSASPGVDPARIGVIGHSLGAEQALMLAALDERVRAAVSSCGYATFAAEKNRMRWARDEWFSYMPKLRPVFRRGQLPEWDWDDVLRLVAPRAVYQHTTREDQIFPESASAYEAGERARLIWKLYGSPDTFVNVLRPGKHAVSDETRAEMYAWLDKQLR